MALQIVFRAEQALTAGLALAARDRTQGVEAAGDGREKSLLGFHIGRDRPEQRRLRLIGAVRAAKPLDGGIGLPARFEEIVDAQPGVLRREFGVVAAPGAAGVAEHQHTLAIIHERLGLGEIGRTGAILHDQPVDGHAALANDPARAASDLGHGVSAEMLDDLVERAGDRRQAGEACDHLVAPRHGLPAFDWLAVAIDRARRQVALRIRERLVELDREGMGEVVEDIFARRQVHFQVAPFLGGDLGEPPFHQRLAGRNDLDDGGMARLQIAGDRADQRRGFHRREQVPEKALLGALEGRAGGGFGLPVQRAGAAVAAGDVGGLHRGIQVVVDDGEGIGVAVVDADLLRGQLMVEQLVFHAFE